MNDFSGQQQKRVIVALDCQTQQQALTIAQKLDPQWCRVKVGKELFTAAGPAVIEALHQLGFEIFLDLKFHDIPNTVAKACQVAAQLGVWMLTLHISGGRRMLEAARDAVMTASTPPLLVGVTVLTSFTQQELSEIGIVDTLSQQVMRLGQLAKVTGLSGLVCSVEEVSVLRDALPTMLLVTPGIRLSGAQLSGDDQRRIATPETAIQRGADYLVIGRPLTMAEDPLQLIKKMKLD